jgi:hypothetical protein
MELDERRIIKFLHLKGLKLDNIATKLSNLYGQDAHAKSSRKYWMHQLKLGTKDLTTQHVGGRPPLDDTGIEILWVLRRSKFSSGGTITDSLGIPPFMVYSHMLEKIGCRKLLISLGSSWPD